MEKTFTIVSTYRSYGALLLLSVLRDPPSLNRCLICFSGAYSRYLFDTRYKDLAITDLAGTRGVDDGLDNAIHQFLKHDYFNFYFWQKIYDVFGAAIELGMALLSAKALDFGNGEPGYANFIERFAHFVELEGFDDSLDFFHGTFL